MSERDAPRVAVFRPDDERLAEARSLLTDLGVDPERIAAVEDSGHGIEAAARAGMHVVGFKHGGDDDTDRSDADYVADAPADLREHLLARV